ncbi:MAG: LpxI family protein [Flavobacteriaceae bacterium]
MLFSRRKQDKPAANARQGRLAIIAGSGPLPAHLIRAASEAGEDPFVIGIEGEAAPGLASPGAISSITEIGKTVSLIQRAGATRVAFAGNFRRPDLDRMRFDWGALKAVPAIAKVKFGGDDAASSIIADIVSALGLTLVGPAEIAPQIVAPAGPVGGRKPARGHLADIEFGFAAIRRMGPLDIGQAVVVANRRIVAVEAAEGTDAMVSRIVELRAGGRFRGRAPNGVLVKAAKPGQELRIDMPTIGAVTVERAVEAGLAGIAAETSRVLIPDIADVARLADEAGLFVVGMAMPDE